MGSNIHKLGTNSSFDRISLFEIMKAGYKGRVLGQFASGNDKIEVQTPFLTFWNNREFHPLFFHYVKSHILAFFTKVLVLMKLGLLFASSGHFTNNFDIDKIYSGDQVLKLSNQIFIEE
jgi:hypothetical protein